MNELIKAARKLLPEYIDEEYPKGESKDRGTATVHIALFLVWLEKQINPNETNHRS